ncbi:MAG: DUF1571 domain-containing protein [Planctomycetaceae bacterium]
MTVFAIQLSTANADGPRSPKKVANRTTETNSSHALSPAILVAKSSAATLSKVSDFTAVFQKMEMVKGKRYFDRMAIKFRKTPFSVYLLFDKPHEGQEVLYVAGKNDGKMLAHGGGVKKIAGTLKLEPTGKRAMKEGRYPITRIGIFKMLQAVLDQWERELKYDDIKLTYYPNAKLYDPGRQFPPMECKVYESRHTRRRRGVQFQITRLYIDKKSNFPVRVEQYGFPIRRGGKPVLLEEYTYWNIRPNVGLKDSDFDPKNPAYKF